MRFYAMPCFDALPKKIPQESQKAQYKTCYHVIGPQLTSGFLLYERRIPPFTELLSGIPCISFRAKAAYFKSSNSTKHMGPLDLTRNEQRLYPKQCVNNCRSSSSFVLAGKLPTYRVLQGGFWSTLLVETELVGMGDDADSTSFCNKWDANTSSFWSGGLMDDSNEEDEYVG